MLTEHSLQRLHIEDHTLVERHLRTRKNDADVDHDDDEDDDAHRRK